MKKTMRKLSRFLRSPSKKANKKEYLVSKSIFKTGNDGNIQLNKKAVEEYARTELPKVMEAFKRLQAE